jgi:hypothetical protein
MEVKVLLPIALRAEQQARAVAFTHHVHGRHAAKRAHSGGVREQVMEISFVEEVTAQNGRRQARKRAHVSELFQ